MSHIINIAQFGGPFASSLTVRTIESANPEDMEARANALLLAPPGSFADIELAAAGTGHAFMLKMTFDTQQIPFPGAVLYFYEANSEDTLKAAAYEALARIAPMSEIVGTALAGCSQGRRWMGAFLVSGPR
jgi:hypothetical protein